MEIVVISIFIKNSKICDKYYLKRRLDMDLKIKTETEEFHGIEFYYIIKPKQQLQMLFIKNSEKCDYNRQSKTLQKCKVSFVISMI